MTREDACEIWLPIIKMGVKSMPECSEAIDMAITALKQEPCEDAISRKAVIEIVEKEEYKGDALFGIEHLPPVTPAEKVGQWINHKCSFCGYGVMPWNDTPYCPNCGAKMQEVEE